MIDLSTVDTRLLMDELVKRGEGVAVCILRRNYLKKGHHQFKYAMTTDEDEAMLAATYLLLKAQARLLENETNLTDEQAMGG